MKWKSISVGILNKAFATEMILTVGVLIASGILLLELRGVLYGQTKISQEEVVSTFADDVENIVDKVVAVTGNATFVYYPTIKSYTLTVKNDTVLINDKISKKTAIFTKTSVDLQDVIFEDSKMIYITKVENNVYITGKCKEVGESCSNSVMCCPGAQYCWGSSFVCHGSCAPNGEYAVDDQTCCSGLLNKTTGKCDEPSCNNDPICDYPQECVDCPDCSGPNPNCIDDHICAPSIGENCVNSADDCKCSDLGMGNCCPSCQESDGNSGCCPNSNVVDKNHCCPVGRPKWCENRIEDNQPICMSNDDYTIKCKKAEFKLIFVPVNYQSNNPDFVSRVEEYKNNLFTETKIGQCQDKIETIIVDQELPLTSCNENLVLTFAENWYISKYGIALPPCSYKNGVRICKFRVIGIDSSPQDYQSCGCAHVPNIYAEIAWVGGGCGRGVITLTHELGHTFGTCDEYSGCVWDWENSIHPLGCPNPKACNCCNGPYGCCSGRALPGGGYCIMGPVNAIPPRHFCESCDNGIDDYITNYLNLC